jgi:hypothetical protein
MRIIGRLYPGLVRSFIAGVGLLIAGSPERADACSCGPPTVTMSPADAATGVPVNAIVIVGFDYAYDVSITLRNEATQEVIPVVQERRATTFFGNTYFATPTAPLAPNTKYVAVAHDPNQPDATATFTTGDISDTTPPAFSGLAAMSLETMTYPIANANDEFCVSSCISAPEGHVSRIHLEYTDRPMDAVHVALQLRRVDSEDAAEVPLTASSPRYLGFESCRPNAPNLEPGAEYCARVVAYDVAGNVAGLDAPEVCTSAQTCEPVLVGTCEPSTECRAPAPPETSGCATTRSSSLLLIALAMLLPKRRTRRAFRGTRRVL